MPPIPRVPPWANADQLLPRGVAQDFVGLIEQASVALQLGRVMRMSEATEAIPVVAFMPQAKWVTPAYGGRKPATKIEWTAQEIKAEEVACVLPVPNAWIQDAHFDVEGQVERSMSQAIATTIDDAILFGTGAPPSFPVGGVVGFMQDTVSGYEPLLAISDAIGVLESLGIPPDGIAGGPSIGAALRAAYFEHGEFATAPSNRLFGLPTRQSFTWTSTTAMALVGGYQHLAIGIREDVRFGRSNDGVLLDDAGAIIATAFQDNVTLVKIYARLGCAVGQPYPIRAGTPGNINPIKPFVGANWTDRPDPPVNGDAETRGARKR